MIIGLGVNYVTEVFSMVATALAEAFDWYKDILSAVGLPWQVFSLVIVGFACTTFLVSSLLGQFRSKADSAVSMSVHEASRRYKFGQKEGD